MTNHPLQTIYSYNTVTDFIWKLCKLLPVNRTLVSSAYSSGLESICIPSGRSLIYENKTEVPKLILGEHILLFPSLKKIFLTRYAVFQLLLSRC
jgi:hypothetical protein